LVSRIAGKVLRAIKEAAGQGKPCITLAALAAKARLSLSEVREAVDELERAGAAIVSGDKVCYVGFEAGIAGLPEGPAVKAVESLARRRSVVAAVEKVAASIPYVDYIVARRDGVIFLIHIVRRGESGERLEAIARKLARQARRIAEGQLDVSLPVKPRLVIPLLLGDYGAPRLVEGVAFRPAAKLAEAILSPETIIESPLARYYYARRLT
jgi:DNA-binding Lrp family transcriptional regulator